MFYNPNEIERSIIKKNKMNYNDLSKSVIFQKDVENGKYYDEYMFYDFSNTYKFFGITRRQLIDIIRDEFNFKYFVCFEAEILYNTSKNIIATNVMLDYQKNLILN
jgi:hypothetical protein